MNYYFAEILFFSFGICIGSFLNVCIYRLPASKSITNPRRSICPFCKETIPFYDNIPVLSYIWLRGRCRHCNTVIPLRYPIVELLSAVMALFVCMKFGPCFEGLIYFTFIALLIIITFIDLDHKIIPDIITLPGIPLFLFLSLGIPSISLIDSLLGILTGGGSLFTVAIIYNLLTKKDGMGGGDIKLLAMIGALIGWQGVLFTIFVSSALGSTIGIALMLRTKKGMNFAVPFGPFLSAGAVLYIFFGTPVINWYFNFLAG